MNKLTEAETEKAIYELESRLTTAIEQTRKGVTDGQIRQAILKVCSELKILAKDEHTIVGRI